MPALAPADPASAPGRVGIFGGTFDPPHNGHLLVAQDALEALALDRLLVIPAGTQPLKSGPRTPAADRLAMVQRGFAGLPGVAVDAVEIERGGLSYMVDTVEHLRRRWPSAALHLLIGEDVVPTLPRWRDPERLLAMVQLVILQRSPAGSAGGSGPDQPVLPGLAGAIRLPTRRVDLSSTEIRDRVRAGRSLAGFVPESVAAYIASSGLYLRVSDPAE